MIEAYKIAANLTITGDAQRKMSTFSNATMRAAKYVAELTKLLKPFDAELAKALKNMTGIASMARSTTTGFKEMSASMRPVNDQFMKFNNRLSGMITRAGDARISLNMMANAANRVAENVGRIRGGFGGGGAGGNGRSSSKKNGGLFQELMHRTPAVYAAYQAKKFATSQFHKDIEYQQEMLQLTSQNINGLDKEEATRFLRTNKGPYSKLSLLSALTDAASITKGREEAELMAPMLASYRFNMDAMSPGAGFSKTQMQAAMKTPEIITGSKDPKVLKPFVEAMFKTSLATGLRVQPSTYLAATKTMRGYAKGMDPNVFFYFLEPLFQEYGSKMGTMINQFYGHAKAGKLTNEAADIAVRMGLVDEKNIHRFKNQRVRSIEPGSMHGTDLMAVNFPKWVYDYWVPGMKKIGANTPSQQENVTAKFFRNTDQALVMALLQQKDKLMQNYEVNMKTKGMAEVEKQNLKELPGVTKAFSEAWVDFQTAFAALVDPYEIQGLQALTKAIKFFTEILAAPLTSTAIKILSKSLWNTAQTVAGVPGISNALDFASQKGKEFHITIHNKIGDHHMNTTLSKILANQTNSIVDHGMTTSNASLFPQSNSAPYQGFGY